MQINSLYAFTLGREWRLSLAEILAVFGTESYQSHTEEVAILQIIGYSDAQLQKKFLSLGGSIRIIRIIGETDERRFATDVLAHITERQKQESKGGSSSVETPLETSQKQEVGGRNIFSKGVYKTVNDGENTISDDKIRRFSEVSKKINFALGAYGTHLYLNEIGMRMKKTLAQDGHSARIVNQDEKNINAASFKKERLGKTGMEYNIISLSPANKEDSTGDQSRKHTNTHTYTYLGYTIACQDIDAYAGRDTGKSRDMVVGMMPPKLVQIMINLALDNTPTLQHSIYDPFCGLGTTLIEAANMGITRVYGSDLAREMVSASTESLREYIKTERMWQDRIKAVGGTPNKDFSNFESKVVELDASNIDRGFRAYQIPTDVTIVSEGYLGEVMSPRDVTLERVQTERKKLASLYSRFFSGLQSAGYSGTIVMTFPFWNIHGTYSYLSEIYDIIEKHGYKIVDLLPGEMGLNTRQGSLLYRRETQTVGREVVRIVKR